MMHLPLLFNHLEPLNKCERKGNTKCQPECVKCKVKRIRKLIKEQKNND